MEVTFITTYPVMGEDKKVKKDKEGQPIIGFKYRWKGTAEELKKYELIQAEHFRKDSTGPLYFSPFYIGEKCDLHISTNNKLYADTSLIDAANSLIKQHGKVGELMAMKLLENGFSAKREQQEIVPDQTPIDE